MKTTSLATHHKAEISEPWVWRTASGESLLPEQMETRHVFNTLRMIWNHVAPEDLRLHPYRRYRSIYSREYMLEAVQHLATELAGRRDLTHLQQRELDEMVRSATRLRIGEAR